MDEEKLGESIARTEMRQPSRRQFMRRMLALGVSAPVAATVAHGGRDRQRRDARAGVHADPPRRRRARSRSSCRARRRF